jgi:hypothetical protein
MLLSVKVSVRLESARISTRPSLPRLTTALEPDEVAMTAPDKSVELETAGWPLTVTCPVTVISPALSTGIAKATME